MKRPLFLLLLLLLTGAGAAISANAAPPAGTTTIALPSVGPSFKPGPGVAAASEYCTTCHSPAYVAIQPPFTAAQWTAEVTKMRRVYGAPIPDDAAATIVQYLTTEYGKP
jgi:hypothetical protein